MWGVKEQESVIVGHCSAIWQDNALRWPPGGRGSEAVVEGLAGL